MTVKELIEHLQREPPDNIVYILDADTGYRLPVHVGVEERAGMMPKHRKGRSPATQSLRRGDLLVLKRGRRKIGLKILAVGGARR